MENELLDKTDRVILSELRKNARISFRELGESINLSANATADRVRRLQERRVIRRFTIAIDERALGNEISAIIDVKLRPGVSADSFEKSLVGLAEVERASLTTGTFDYSLVVRSRNTESLGKLTEYLRLNAGASETHSRLLLREYSSLE